MPCSLAFAFVSSQHIQVGATARKERISSAVAQNMQLHNTCSLAVDQPNGSKHVRFFAPDQDCLD